MVSIRAVLGRSGWELCSCPTSFKNVACMVKYFLKAFFSHTSPVTITFKGNYSVASNVCIFHAKVKS